jgi:hypothetical protein
VCFYDLLQLLKGLFIIVQQEEEVFI